jgi:hypothetical protein
MAVDRHRGGSHKGNNGLLGKPSNNKGKKRKVNVPRATSVDVEVLARIDPSGADDLWQDLSHPPMTAYMIRLPWIEHLVDAMLAHGSHAVEESPELVQFLGHTAAETNCIFQHGNNTDKVSIVKGWRQNITVTGQHYEVTKVKRNADRKVRGYHLFMCSTRSGIPRNQLAMISRDWVTGTDVYTASHVCGGFCVNHAIVELNSVNQSRKVCHRDMKEALRSAHPLSYKTVRERCRHVPRCFVNPLANGISVNACVVD